MIFAVIGNVIDNNNDRHAFLSGLRHRPRAHPCHHLGKMAPAF
jgi:hypothetical protein